MKSQIIANASKPVNFARKFNPEIALKIPNLPKSYISEFIKDGRTPARALTDEVLSILFEYINNDGYIIELGAAGDYYKKFFSTSQKYMTSNLADGSDITLDMMNITLPNGSVDALFSAFAIEHLDDYATAVSEMVRVLKKNGRLLLVAPFLYFYHGAPDDYFRFTESALRKILKALDIKMVVPLGSRSLFTAEMLHEKDCLGGRSKGFNRILLRMVALPFLYHHIANNLTESANAFAYVILCEKKD